MNENPASWQKAKTQAKSGQQQKAKSSSLKPMLAAPISGSSSEALAAASAASASASASCGHHKLLDPALHYGNVLHSLAHKLEICMPRFASSPLAWLCWPTKLSAPICCILSLLCSAASTSSRLSPAQPGSMLPQQRRCFIKFCLFATATRTSSQLLNVPH